MKLTEVRMIENRPFKNPKIKVCSECKTGDISELSVEEVYEEKVYQLTGCSSDELPERHPLSPKYSNSIKRSNQLGNASNMQIDTVFIHGER